MRFWRVFAALIIAVTTYVIGGMLLGAIGIGETWPSLLAILVFLLIMFFGNADEPVD